MDPLIHAAALLLVALASAAIGCTLHRMWQTRLRTRPKKMELVVVHTKAPDDQSIRGLYYERGPEWIALLEASIASSDGWREIPGQAVIPLPSISWIQKLAAAPPTGRK